MNVLTNKARAHKRVVLMPSDLDWRRHPSRVPVGFPRTALREDVVASAKVATENTMLHFRGLAVVTRLTSRSLLIYRRFAIKNAVRRPSEQVVCAE